MGVFVFTHGVIPENRPHAHLDFMKIAYILDGEYDFRVGDSEFSVGPRALVVVPKGSFHAFTTATGGRMLFACSPSGNEELFMEMGRLGPEATAEQLSELNDRFRTVSLPGDEGSPWRGMFAAEPRQNIDGSDYENG
ncbi:MAG TPA: cupin domain-containing protein [Acidimicrobiales bacterium]|nr:cupin domain-containing protein [Acidimicrobiales bacterium]